MNIRKHINSFTCDASIQWDYLEGLIYPRTYSQMEIPLLLVGFQIISENRSCFLSSTFKSYVFLDCVVNEKKV